MLAFSFIKTISWICHVDQTNDCTHAQYDMIICDDLMQELGIDLLYYEKCVVWEENKLPIEMCGMISSSDYSHNISRKCMLKTSHLFKLQKMGESKFLMPISVK
jgi:hypothetical protein